MKQKESLNFIPIARMPWAVPVDNQGAGGRPTGRIVRCHGFYPWGSRSAFLAPVLKVGGEVWLS